MDDVKLILPCDGYKEELLSVINEFISNGENIKPYGLYYGETDYDKIIKLSNDYHMGVNVPEGFVPCTTYWLVREGDNANARRILGASNIRHYLSGYMLETYGGHVGYGIRPSERRKGYATKMLELTLEKCREMGLKRAMVSCDKDNLGSAKTITNNGGILDAEIDVDGSIIQRYWIEL